MLFSATNLARHGTAAYCEDLVTAIGRLKRQIGEHVLFTALPHLFMGGCGDSGAVRSAVEVSVWANHYFGRERLLLKQSFKTANELVIEGGVGSQPAMGFRLRLPSCGGGGGEDSKVWISDGLVGLPAAVGPANEAQELRMFQALVTELRSGLALDLDTTAVMKRDVIPAESNTAVATEAYLIVGGSNAARLYKAFTEVGIAADLINIPNLRVLRGTGEVIAEKIREAVGRKKPAAIILWFMDNSIFEAMTEEGSRIPPRKLEGRFHLDGDIVVADRAATIRLLRLCRPAFIATAGINTVMMSPLPRFVTRSCCKDPEHMGNRTAPDFFAHMKEDLARTVKVLKEFMHNDDYQNIRVMDPWVGLRHLQPEAIWGEDPVHVKPEHYKKMAEGVKLTLGKIMPKRRRESFSGNGLKRSKFS
jgi:hypothetical protein